MEGASAHPPIDRRALFARITRRLIPYLFVLYILAYLDRVNVGFAALEMKRDLRLSDAVYGTGAGIFFLGSSLFDLPSNLILNRVGARRWIARIMMSWGVIATAMAFVRGPWSFCILRFLLGVAEAGFVPGMLLYLTYWFPVRERARAVAKFMTATSLAGVVGGPLSGVLLKLDGASGLRGWQWLFLVEGIPSILVGISVLKLLRNGPEEASWLSADERTFLRAELEADRRNGGADRHSRFSDVFRMPAVWLLAAVYFVTQVGVYIVNLWSPLILAALAHGTIAGISARVAQLSAYPYLAAAVFTVIVGWSSDRFLERRAHLAACLVLSAGGFAWAAVAHTLPAALLAVTFAAIGLWSSMGPFWALFQPRLSGAAAAGGIALIHMTGGFGAFFGPYMTGRLRESTHSFASGLYLMSGLALVAAILCFTVREIQPGRDPVPAAVLDQPL